LGDEQKILVGGLIERLAVAHGTMPFVPHLTVCSPPSEACWDAAADYVRGSKALPFRLAHKRVSFSTAAPLRAVVIDVEDTPDLRTFRDDLRRITGAAEPAPPHISLLYAVDQAGRQPDWSSDKAVLEGIAEECTRYLGAAEFILGRPVIVATDGAWTNIRSWRVARTL
jgi:2'-5' RNA ligase